MTTFTFRPAVRENIGLLIGLIGASGGGKTFSALRLATGLAGGKRFVIIDTESGRAKHYADRFQFDHGDLTAPYRPDRYREAIEAAIRAGYPVVVVDSASHEHAGEGGLLDWHEEELDRMAGKEWQKREACKLAAWVQPKMAHKKLMQRLINLPPHVHLILCFRAEEKVEMVRGNDGKTQVVPKKSLAGYGGRIPICEKTVPYELTASFHLTPDKPGVPQPIKLQEQHGALVPLDQAITEKCGEQLAAWARGGTKPASAPRVAPNDPKAAVLKELTDALVEFGFAGHSDEGNARRQDLLEETFG
jgi:hypothetical protein